MVGGGAGGMELIVFTLKCTCYARNAHYITYITYIRFSAGVAAGEHGDRNSIITTLLYSNSVADVCTTVRVQQSCVQAPSLFSTYVLGRSEVTTGSICRKLGSSSRAMAVGTRPLGSWLVTRSRGQRICPTQV